MLNVWIRIRKRWNEMVAETGSGVRWPVLVKRLWVAIFVSFLFLRMTVTPFWAEQNRFFFHWQRSDALAIVALIAGGGVLLFLLYEALGMLGSAGCVLRKFLFVLVGFFYLRIALLEVVFADGDIPVTAAFATKVLHAVLLVYFVWHPVAAARWLARGCLLISPVLVMFLWSVLTAQPYQATQSVAREPLGVELPARARKILLVIFDDLAYREIFKDGSVRQEYPGLRRLAEQSVVFHNARSPAASTLQSVPQILWGVRGVIRLEQRRLVVERLGSRAPLQGIPSIFAEMREAGYETKWFGMYFPSAVFKGDQSADQIVIRNPQYKPLGTSCTRVGASLLMLHLRKRMPAALPVFSALYTRVAIGAAIEYDDWIHRMAIEQVRDPQASFAFLHYCIPHGPLFHDEFGGVSDMERIYPATSETAYRGALRVVDRHVQDLLDELEQQAWGKQTMLIVTADHAFREADDLAAGDALHVPLIVRLPGSASRIDVIDPVQLTDLKAALSRCLRGSFDVDTLVDGLAKQGD